MLPLVPGMPVALMDHLDRNPKKILMRGRTGYVDSWILDDPEDSVFDEEKRILKHPPKAVLVQFTEQVLKNDEWAEELCKWTIDGIDRPGVYPVFLCKRGWFLDQQRKYPKLKVDRWQIPLAPAYAITAHSSQGRTLPAAFIDLQIGKGVSRTRSAAIY